MIVNNLSDSPDIHLLVSLQRSQVLLDNAIVAQILSLGREARLWPWAPRHTALPGTFETSVFDGSRYVYTFLKGTDPIESVWRQHCVTYSSAHSKPFITHYVRFIRSIKPKLKLFSRIKSLLFFRSSVLHYGVIFAWRRRDAPLQPSSCYQQHAVVLLVVAVELQSLPQEMTKVCWMRIAQEAAQLLTMWGIVRLGWCRAWGEGDASKYNNGHHIDIQNNRSGKSNISELWNYARSINSSTSQRSIIIKEG